MAVTIHVNGKSNSLVHKGSMCIAKSTLPDVCKTPSPGGPVPVPYPVIISMSSDLKKGTKTVKVDGGNMAAIKGSEFSRCSGDEPGTAGGVKSSTNMKEATWITSSPDVKLDGKNACRLSDKMQMNHGNTVCLAGATQVPVPTGKCEDIDLFCCVVERCDRKHYDVSKVKKKARCAVLGSKKHECVENSLKKAKDEKGNPRFECENSYNMDKTPPECVMATAKGGGSVPAFARQARAIAKKYGFKVKRPDVKTPGHPCKVFDAKFPCPDKVKKAARTSKGRLDSPRWAGGVEMMKKEQRDAYRKISGPENQGGEVRALSPGDCKDRGDNCAKCE